MSINSTTEPKFKSEEDPHLSSEENVFVTELMALSAKGLIMKRGTVSLRSFSLQGYGSALIALMLYESDDGYFVGLPAQLSSQEDGSVSATFVTATPIVKIQKHGVALVSLPTQQAFFHYLKSITNNYGMLPGYFTEERRLQISSLISQMAPTFDKPVNVSGQSESDNAGSTSKTSVLEIPPGRRADLIKRSTAVKNPILPSQDSYYIENKSNKYLH